MTDRKAPILEPTTQAFVDALAAQGGKPLYELSYADARKLLEDAQAIEVTKLPADVEDKTLPVVTTATTTASNLNGDIDTIQFRAQFDF